MIYLSGDMNEFVKIYNECSDVVVWGAGECANDFRELFMAAEGKALKVKYYIDKNIAVCDGKNIFSIERFKEEKETIDLVLIATQYTSSVLDELKDMGYTGKIISVFNIIYKQKWGDTREIQNHMDALKDILADNKSRELVDIICKKRKSLDVDYSEYCEGNQYFVENIIKRESDAVFVDAGAYDGETIEEFIEFQKNEYKKILSFEMNEVNYQKIMQKKFDDRVKVYNMGLWDTKTECRYNLEEDSSSLGEGDYIAQCVKLDEILSGEKVTFIKMDIEGAEQRALLGAEKSIKKWKPQLAICIYHKQNDLWEIPFMVHSMVPEYRLYIRHHMPNINETVLYAVLEDNK